MIRTVLVVLLLSTTTSITLIPEISFGQEQVRPNVADEREHAAEATRRQLKKDGIITDPSFSKRVLMLKRWTGDLENLRLLSDYAPAGFFSALKVPNLNDQAAKILFPKSSFQKVSIRECPLTDEGLEFIAKSKTIEELRIEKCEITDKGLKTLQQMQQLKSIRVWNTKVTPDGLEALQAALPDCLVEGDVIPTHSNQLFQELGVAAFYVLSQNVEPEKRDELWRGLYNPHSEVGKLRRQEVQCMRQLHSEFIKVLAEREDQLKDGEMPSDVANRITNGLNKIDESDKRLTPIAIWLIDRYERGFVKRHPKKMALLAHYMDALIQSMP